MKFFIGIGALALFSGFAVADTINEGVNPGTFTAEPASLSSPGPTIPYWDNHSGDFGGTNTGNIGYFLTATGNFSGGTNDSPNDYVSATGVTDAPTAFNLVHTTNSLILSLLGVTTGNTTDIIGIYNTSVGAASEILLFGPGTLTVGTSANASSIAFGNVGFYLTDSAGATWFSQTSLNVNGSTGDVAGHQHFALFTTGTDPNTFYLGVEDWIANSGEGVNGDYNDLIFKINADQVVPEPATFGLLGAGLLGLGFARFRNRKTRA
jgi:hypothetical protein